MTFYDYHNFYQLEGDDNQNVHAKFQVERSKTYWDI